MSKQEIYPIKSEPYFPHKKWKIAFISSLIITVIFFSVIIYSFMTGLGILGLNNTVSWGFYIVNFVFWIGIGHAGTFISAILYLFRQRWRTSINRAAEAMTIFAVMTAAIFPIIHIGRPWFAYWLIPYPNERGPVWPNFESPLFWDMAAISTYFIISLIFWYVGLIPDLANKASKLSELKQTTKAKVYRFLSLGWTGSVKTWLHYEKLILLLAVLAAPLVISVHSIVSYDFAASVLPGWHTTVLPPYFVDGAIFSGFAMVLLIMIITRKAFRLEKLITIKHLEKMSYVILLTSLLLTLFYLSEFFTAMYSHNQDEIFAFKNRFLGNGKYAILSLMMIGFNVFIPQLLWFRRIRQNVKMLFVIAILINIGMWAERFVIFIISQHRDFLVSSWDVYIPTIYDWLLLIGSFGFFFMLYLLFVKFLPMISETEMKAEQMNENHEKLIGYGTSTHSTSSVTTTLSNHTSTSLSNHTSISNLKNQADVSFVLNESILSDIKNKKSILQIKEISELLNVVDYLQEKKIKIIDVYTKYSVKGLEEKLKLPKSNISKFTFIFGLLGAILSFLFFIYVDVFDWPQIFGGKPFFKWPAYVPIIFESLILFAGVSSFIAFIYYTRTKKRNIDFKKQIEFKSDYDFVIQVDFDNSY